MPFNPWWRRNELELLRREMDSLLSSFSQGGTRPPLWRETRLFPLLNVWETDEAYLISAEIPGMNVDDLEVKIDGDTLTLKGERKVAEVPENASFHRRERATGIFQRSLTLPGKVDSENVNATYKNGVITVMLQKEKAAQPRQISVSTE
jgi:HSP20 family protein